MKFSKEFSIANVLTILALFVAALAAWFTMPQKLIAEADARFVAKDNFEMTCTRLDRIENKLDKLLFELRFKVKE